MRRHCDVAAVLLCEKSTLVEHDLIMRSEGGPVSLGKQFTFWRKVSTNQAVCWQASEGCFDLFQEIFSQYLIFLALPVSLNARGAEEWCMVSR